MMSLSVFLPLNWTYPLGSRFRSAYPKPTRVEALGADVVLNVYC